MRKADYLRKEYNRIVKRYDCIEEVDHQIHLIDLPMKFWLNGDIEPPFCVPYADAKGNCGIAVEHTYSYEGDVFSYYEYFPFRKVYPVQ